MDKQPDFAAEAMSAILRVGDGRGFVVSGAGGGRYVITAAHCLTAPLTPRRRGRSYPALPPCCGASYCEERTYRKLLAPLGGKPAAWAECLFVDPVADIAVLGAPDNQTFSDEWWPYLELVDAEEGHLTPLKIAKPGKEGWLLSLDGNWFRCGIAMDSRNLWFTGMEGKFVGGMSGSPIVSAEGAAIGVACLGTEDGAGHQKPEQGPEPSLIGNLPGWLLQEAGCFRRKDNTK